MIRVIPGHGLVAEGAPHDAAGQRISTGWIMGVAGAGRALCGCGEMSDELPSSAARRRWHQVHKYELIEGPESDDHDEWQEATP